MRIGILTLPLHTNYGGILQAYALQTVLERMGHEVVVFDQPYVYSISNFRKLFAYPKRMISKYVLRKHGIVRWEEYVSKMNLTIRQYTQPFIDNNIHRKEVEKLSELNERDYDMLVVGSDQIWRPLYYPEIENAYLQFAKRWKVKRIAYAPSFGVDKWEYNAKQTKICKQLLAKFDAVSVREITGVTLCKNYLDHDAEWVLDPTMLLTANDYISLFERSKTPQSKGTLLNYILDASEKNQRLVSELALRKGLQPFRVNSFVEDTQAPLEKRIQPSVESWLRGFYDAEFVLTDSFHACVFSILFKKQFVVVANRRRGMARIESLLGKMGLRDRVVENVEDAVLLSTINYDMVYAKLEQMRAASMQFLSHYAI